MSESNEAKNLLLLINLLTELIENNQLFNECFLYCCNSVDGDNILFEDICEPDINDFLPDILEGMESGELKLGVDEKQQPIYYKNMKVLNHITHMLHSHSGLTTDEFNAAIKLHVFNGVAIVIGSNGTKESKELFEKINSNIIGIIAERKWFFTLLLMDCILVPD